MIEKIRNSIGVKFHIITAILFIATMVAGYSYDGLNFVQGWGGGIAAVIATFFLVFKSQGYWAWMIVNAGLWAALFFNMGLPMLAYLQISILIFSIYGAIQWALVKYDIGFKLSRRSDVVGAFLASVLFIYSLYAYRGMTGYVWTMWWAFELGSVVTAILAMWMDAYRYKVNWVMWTLSNCCSAPLFFHLSSWGPFYTIFVYQLINVIGYVEWRKEEKKMVAEARSTAIKKGGTFAASGLVTRNA